MITNKTLVSTWKESHIAVTQKSSGKRPARLVIENGLSAGEAATFLTQKHPRGLGKGCQGGKIGKNRRPLTKVEVELTKVKQELIIVKMEHDILKKPPHILPRSRSQLCDNR